MILVASHNVETVEIAKRLTEDCGFKTNPRVRFGQLRGFSDQVTGDLSAEGFKVYKYVPFGPTEQVMPYLVRRGQESRQVLRE
jgi:proline dehydrogenase